MSIFDQMLARYEVEKKSELTNATYEVMQEVTLAGLYRGGFFNKAAFLLAALVCESSWIEALFGGYGFFTDGT